MRNGLYLTKNSIVVFINYLMVLVTILFSKTMYFGVEKASTFQFLFYCMCILGFFLCKGSIRTLKRNLLIVFGVGILLSFQVINSSAFASDGINTILGLFLKFFSCAFLAASMSQKRYRQCYINIMGFIALTSFPFFIISIVSPELAKSLASTSFHWTNAYEYSWFYTWGRGGNIIQRNCGPFWEAGAFQGFLILALLFLLHNVKNDELDIRELKAARNKFVLFCITILTTKSTTGYILLMAVVAFFYNDIIKILDVTKKNKKYVVLIAALISIAMIGYIVYSGNIVNKLNNTHSDSAAIRGNDVVMSLFLIGRAGLVGLGPTVTKNSYEVMFNMVNNSVGLLSMAYTYGLLFAIYLVVYFLKWLKRFFNVSGFQLLIYILIFTVLHMTEGLWFLPVYMLTIMNNRKDES